MSEPSSISGGLSIGELVLLAAETVSGEAGRTGAPDARARQGGISLEEMLSFSEETASPLAGADDGLATGDADEADDLSMLAALFSPETPFDGPVADGAEDETAAGAYAFGLEAEESDGLEGECAVDLASLLGVEPPATAGGASPSAKREEEPSFDLASAFGVTERQMDAWADDRRAGEAPEKVPDPFSLVAMAGAVETTGAEDVPTLGASAPAGGSSRRPVPGLRDESAHPVGAGAVASRQDGLPVRGRFADLPVPGAAAQVALPRSTARPNAKEGGPARTEGEPSSSASHGNESVPAGYDAAPGDAFAERGPSADREATDGGCAPCDSNEAAVAAVADAVEPVRSADREEDPASAAPEQKGEDGAMAESPTLAAAGERTERMAESGRPADRAPTGPSSASGEASSNRALSDNRPSVAAWAAARPLGLPAPAASEPARSTAVQMQADRAPLPSEGPSPKPRPKAPASARRRDEGSPHPPQPRPPARSAVAAAAAVADPRADAPAPVAVPNGSRVAEPEAKPKPGRSLLLAGVAFVAAASLVAATSFAVATGGVSVPVPEGAAAVDPLVGGSVAEYHYLVEGSGGKWCPAVEKATFDDTGALVKSCITVDLPDGDQAAALLEDARALFGDALTDGKVVGAVAAFTVVAQGDPIDRDAYTELLRRGTVDFSDASAA